MKEQLCGQCESAGSCFLREAVDSAIKRIPSVKKQHIEIGMSNSMEVTETLNKIDSFKKDARKILGCPNANSITVVSNKFSVKVKPGR